METLIWNTKRAKAPFWDKAIEILTRYRVKNQMPSGFLHVIRVDWLRDNKDIVKSFAQWVKQERNSDYGMYNSRGKDRMGPSALSSALRSLGAWSLSRRLNPKAPPGLTLDDALAQTRREDNDPGLYPSADEAKRAKRAARRRINCVSPWELFYDCRAAATLLPPVAIRELSPKGEYSALIDERGVLFERHRPAEKRRVAKL